MTSLPALNIKNKYFLRESGSFCTVCCVAVWDSMVRARLNKSISYNAWDQRSQSQSVRVLRVKTNHHIIDNTLTFAMSNSHHNINLSSRVELFVYLSKYSSISELMMWYWRLKLQLIFLAIRHQTRLDDGAGPHNNHSPPPAPDSDNACWQPPGPGVCTLHTMCWWPWLTVNHSITLAEVFTDGEEK